MIRGPPDGEVLALAVRPSYSMSGDGCVRSLEWNCRVSAGRLQALEQDPEGSTYEMTLVAFLTIGRVDSLRPRHVVFHQWRRVT